MRSSMLDARPLVARALVIALLPAAPVLFFATRSLTVATAALALFVVTFVLATGWLFPRRSRIDAALELLPTLFAIGVAPLAALLFAIVQLCSSGADGTTYLSSRGALVVAGALVVTYVGGSTWALAREGRFVWAWPLAVVLTTAVGVAALALVEGGPHACYT